jgi:hypothetical protein
MFSKSKPTYFYVLTGSGFESNKTWPVEIINAVRISYFNIPDAYYYEHTKLGVG